MKNTFKYSLLLLTFSLLITGLANAGVLVLDNQTDYELLFNPKEFSSQACAICPGKWFIRPRIFPKSQLSLDFESRNYNGNNFDVSSPSWGAGKKFTVEFKQGLANPSNAKVFLVPCANGKAQCPDEKPIVIRYKVDKNENVYQVIFTQK